MLKVDTVEINILCQFFNKHCACFISSWDKFYIKSPRDKRRSRICYCMTRMQSFFAFRRPVGTTGGRGDWRAIDLTDQLTLSISTGGQIMPTTYYSPTPYPPDFQTFLWPFFVIENVNIINLNGWGLHP